MASLFGAVAPTVETVKRPTNRAEALCLAACFVGHERVVEVAEWLLGEGNPPDTRTTFVDGDHDTWTLGEDGRWHYGALTRDSIEAIRESYGGF